MPNITSIKKMSDDELLSFANGSGSLNTSLDKLSDDELLGIANKATPSSAPEKSQPPSSRTTLGGVATSFGEGIARGVTTEIPSMAGGALEFAGSAKPREGTIIPSPVDVALKVLDETGLGGVIEDFGRGLKEWSDAKAKSWFGEEKKRQGLERVVYEGTKMLAPSVVPGAALSAGVRVLTGVGKLVKAAKVAQETAIGLEKAGKIAEAAKQTEQAAKLMEIATNSASLANNVASAGVAGLFGLSQAQSTVDTANKRAGLLQVQGDLEGSDKVRAAGQGMAPRLTGAIEAGGEFLGTKYLGKLFRLDEADVAKRGAKQLAKDFLKTLGVEIGTEMGQQSGEAYVEKVAGIRPDADPLEEALDVVGPTAFMTLLTFGVAGAANRIRRSDDTIDLLDEKPDQPDIAEQIKKAIEDVRKEEGKRAATAKTINIPRLGARLALPAPDQGAIDATGKEFELQGKPYDPALKALEESAPTTAALPMPPTDMGEGFTVKDTENEQDITAKTGEPFKTENNAKAAGDRQGIDWNIYNVIPKGDGYVIARKLGKPIKPENTIEKIDEAANEAATSPLNDLPQPTDAQKEAGNYKKGHVSVQGLDVTIENPRGSERSGKDPNGKPWSIVMQNPYGYFKRTEGKDGDQIDVIVGPKPESGKAFIVDQIDPKTGKFDEHKSLVGFETEEEARKGYLENYEPGWKGLGAITEMPIDQFKGWVKEGRKTKPVAYKERAGLTPPGETVTQPSAPAPEGNWPGLKKDARLLYLYNKGKHTQKEALRLAAWVNHAIDTGQHNEALKTPEAKRLFEYKTGRAVPFTSVKDMFTGTPFERRDFKAMIAARAAEKEEEQEEKLSDIQSYALSDMRSRLLSGEAGGFKGEDATTGEKTYLKSGYPLWFQDMIKLFGRKGSPTGKTESLSAKDVAYIINKGMTEKPLTNRQSIIWNYIKRVANSEITTGEYRAVANELERMSYAEQIRQLEEEGIDAGAISDSKEDLKADIIEEIAAEKDATEDELDFISDEADKFFEAVAKGEQTGEEAQAPKPTPKGEFKNADLEGFSERETFGLINPETEISKPLSEQATPKNAGLFVPEKKEVFSTKAPIPIIQDMLDNPEYQRKSKNREVSLRWMSPDEYLKLQADVKGLPLDQDLRVADNERVDQYAADMRKIAKGEVSKQFPALWVERARGNQEGKHRALAAKKAGIEKVPVYEIKEVPDEPAAKPKPETKKEPAGIGKNSEGQTIFEDENGVRSIKRNGVRIQEAVQIIPTRAGVQTGVDIANRDERFKTVEEVKPEAQKEDPYTAAVGKIAGKADRAKERGYEFVYGETKKGGNIYYEMMGMFSGGAADKLIEAGITIKKIKTEAPAYGADNKIFTKDKADKARAILKAKLSGTQLNAGIDPEVLQAGIDLAGYHIESGARKFADYTKAMIEDIGETIRPYLKSFYLAVRNYPGIDNKGMNTEAELDRIAEKITPLTYEQFAKQYQEAFDKTFQYKLDEVGSKIYTDKMAELADDYPEFLERFEQEQEEAAAKTPDKEEIRQRGIAYDAGLAGKKFPDEYEQTQVLRAAYDAGLAGKMFPGTDEERETRRQLATENANKKAEGAAFKIGDRVVLEDGSHGAITRADAIVMQALFGGKKETSYMYEVMTDAGEKKMPITSQIKKETAPETQQEYEIRMEEKARQRQSAAKETATKPASLSAYGLAVTKGTTKKGQEVWNVSGKETRTWKDTIKRIGGRWYMPKKVWSFYKGDPTDALLKALPPIKDVHPDVRHDEPAKKETVPAEKGFAPEILVEGKWSRNGLVFATEQEAADWASDRHSRWIMSEGHRAVAVNEAPKHTFVNGELGDIKAEGKPISAEILTAYDTPGIIAAREKSSKIEDTIKINTPERIKLRQDMADEYYGNGAVNKNKRADIVLGGPGSGKSTWLAEPLAKEHGSLLIDSDTIKARLPEFDNGIGAGAVHQESAYIADILITDKARENGDNIILPRLGKKLETMQKLVDLLNENGYEVHLHFMDLAPEESAKRAVSRFNATGRFVDPVYVINEVDIKPKNVYNNIKGYEGIKSYEAYDNNVPRGQAPKLYERSGNNAEALEGERRLQRSGNSDDLSAGNRPEEAGRTETAVKEAKNVNTTGSRTPSTGTSEDDRASSEAQSSENLQAVEGEEGAAGLREGSGRADDGELQQQSVRDGHGSAEAGAGRHPKISSKSDNGQSTALGGNAGNIPGVRRSRRGTDHIIEPGSIDRTGSWFNTAKNNLDIIELVKKLDEEKRLATPEEQKLLAQYTGFGASEIANNLFPGYSYNRKVFPSWQSDSKWRAQVERLVNLLTPEEIETAARSTQYAHYTSPAIINSIYKAINRFGFPGGKVLEPGMGVGSFFGLMPLSMRNITVYTGVEFDATTAKIAKHLYPNQNIIEGDFTKQKFPNDFFDLAVGNPPFSSTKILTDPDYKKLRLSLHDYFFVKSMDKVRPGGLMVFITSRYTMDKQDDKVRNILNQKADLLGAIRLPQTAFKKNAGTEVVTDVLFLRKKVPGENSEGMAWQNTAPVTTDKGEFQINEYFVKNPQMVLGTHSGEGKMYSKNEYTVKPLEGDIEQAFEAATYNLPEKVFSMTKASPEAQQQAAIEADFNPLNKKEGGLYVSDKGEIMSTESGRGVPLHTLYPKITPAEKKWFKDYVGLRDAVKAAQYDQLNDGAWEKTLQNVKKIYSGFVKTHGRILDFKVLERKSLDEDGNEQIIEIRKYKNDKLLLRDVESPLVAALDKIAEDGTISDGPFLQGRTIKRPTEPQIKTVPDALAVSLNNVGHLDINDIAARIDKPINEVIDQLGDLVYESPDKGGEYILADEYLSGNVVEKLAVAKAAADVDPKYTRNVDALLKVQPTPLASHEITIMPGVNWIPLNHYNDFVKDVLNLKNRTVEYYPASNSWEIKGGAKQGQRGSSNEWSTGSRGANEIFEAVLNNSTIRVLTTVSDGNGGSKTVLDPAQTAAANDMAKKMRARFKSWVWEDANRTRELLEIYNQSKNTIIPRSFDGKHLTLPGVSLRYSLLPHQKNAIWRVVQDGNTYIFHAVGAGKTYEMVAAGMEMRRLSLIKKPIYVVPNHMLRQFSNEFQDLYPMAHIMVADEENFHTTNRKRFMAQAALNNPDAVVITHSAFGLLKMKEENIRPVRDRIIAELQESLEEMEEDKSGNRIKIKQMEKRIEQVEQRFDSMIAGGDNVMTFEDMGADFLFVDEAHQFRKLDFTTNRQAKGIDPNGSRRAMDLLIKTKWLGSQSPGRSHVFASGTPVTNTMGELYTIMKFFMEDQMDKEGIGYFDSWASEFGELETKPEMNAAGRYEMVERFSKFNNLQPLMSRVRSFMDVLTGSQLGEFVKRPKIKGGQPAIVITPPSDALKSYQDNVLMPRIEASKRWKPSPQEKGNPDPMINIITDGRLASIDLRYVTRDIMRHGFPAPKNDPNSKLNQFIDKIIELHNATKNDTYLDPISGKESHVKGGGTIAFFNHDFGKSVAENRGFDARAWAMDKFKKAGIKASEIAWIDDYDTAAKKESMFKEMRNGHKRILIGSAKKMGTGMNVQTRLANLVYLDPPWYPSDVEQPVGRIIRQGNQNEEAGLFYFATKGSYDATMWGMVQRKAKFIEDVFTGKGVNSMDDISETSLYELAAALASGDERAIRLAGLNAEIDNLQNLRSAHYQTQNKLEQDKSHIEFWIPRQKETIKHLEEASKKGVYIGREIEAKSGNQRFTERKAFGDVLIDKIMALQKAGEEATEVIGEISGLPITARIYRGSEVTRISEAGKMTKEPGAITAYVSVKVTDNIRYPVADGVFTHETVDAVGLVAKIANRVNAVDSELSKAKSELDARETELKKINSRLGAPFEFAQELNEKTAESAQIKHALEVEATAVPPAPETPPATPAPTGGTVLNMGIDPTQTLAVLRGLKNNIQAAMPHLEALGRSVYEGGAKNLVKWRSQMRARLGDLWNSFKDSMRSVWEKVSKPLKNEIGAIGTDINARPANPLQNSEEPGMVQQKWDAFLYQVQDRFRYLSNLQKSVEKERGEELAEGEDTYLAETRYHGMAAAAVDEFEEKHVDPIIKLMDEGKLSLEDVGLYLHARHAREANARLRQINPSADELDRVISRVKTERETLKNERAKIRKDHPKDYPINKRYKETEKKLAALSAEIDRLENYTPLDDNTALSGMSDAEAISIQRNLEMGAQADIYRKIGEAVDNMTTARRELLVEAGLETPETIANWENLYEHYVPLMREGKGSNMPRRGKGYEVKGGQKIRTGSERDVINILANLVAQHESTIIRAEKAKVGRAFLEFAQNNQGPWKIDTPEQVATLTKDGLVTYRPNPMGYSLADNVLAVRVDGEDHHITFDENDENAMKIASALKNLDGADSGALMRILSKVSRYLAMVNTALNPEFIISNFARDIQTAAYNMSDSEADKIRMKAIKQVGEAYRGIYRYERTTDRESEWAKWFDRFRHAGGQTGWIQSYDNIQDREKELINKVKRMHPGKIRLVKRGIEAAFDYIADVNTAVENAIRLSVFKNLIEAGVSEAKSAKIAKELTVNFNRRGNLGPVMNTLYLFFNASMQGSARIIMAAAKSKKVRKLMAATVGFAFLLDIANRLIGGDGDDGEPLYDKIPNHEKDRNLIIMLGKAGYIKIPLPWGYNVFHVLGQTAGEVITKKHNKVIDSTLRLAGAAINAFNPMGGEGSILQTLSPTLTDPLVQWAENKDWSGRKLRPSANVFAEKPASQTYWKSVREPSRLIAEKINSLTGGDEVRPGKIDFSPEALDLAIDTFTGGTGKFVSNLISTPIKLAKGDTVETYEIPFLRRVYGKPGKQTLTQEFYENIDEVRLTSRQLNHYKETPEKVREIVKDHKSEVRLIGRMKATQDALEEIRETRKSVDKIKNDDVKKERLKTLETSEEKIMMNFNKHYYIMKEKEK